VPTQRPPRTLYIATATLPLLQFLERLRPVASEQLREGAIGQELSAGLASRAVIGFVLRVDDPLNDRAADRAGLAVAAVNGHPLAEGRDFFGKASACLRHELPAPFLERLARGAVEPFDLICREAARPFRRREARAMQDLVGVGVADAREDPRVRQRALGGVILARQGLA